MTFDDKNLDELIRNKLKLSASPIPPARVNEFAQIMSHRDHNNWPQTLKLPELIPFSFGVFLLSYLVFSNSVKVSHGTELDSYVFESYQTSELLSDNLFADFQLYE